MASLVDCAGVLASTGSNRAPPGPAVPIDNSPERLLEELYALQTAARLLQAADLRDPHFDPRSTLAILRERRALIETAGRLGGHLSDTTEPPSSRPDLDALIGAKLTQHQALEVPGPESIPPRIG